MTPADRSRELAQLLDEQVAYYRALAAEYEDHALPLAGGDELTAALDAFRPTGSVLELACGPGTWTGQLLRHATEVTAVDASHEMLAIASARHSSDRVRFIQADIFSGSPIAVMTWSFSASGSHTYRSNCLSPSGRSWRTAWNRLAASSSSTTHTEPQMSLSRVNRPRSSADG
jgi:SAM-dependent methyltransferase